MIEPSWCTTGAWAVFTTVRYAIAVTIYVSNDRKSILIVLASVSAFTVTLVSASIVLSVFSRTLGWDLGLRSSYVTIQTLLGYSISLSLLGPAITNFILVFLWRNASDAGDSLRGRCSWDIDVAWSGTGGQCTTGRAKGWGFYLGGAVFRLLLTFTAVVRRPFIICTIPAGADIRVTDGLSLPLLQIYPCKETCSSQAWPHSSPLCVLPICSFYRIRDFVFGSEFPSHGVHQSLANLSRAVRTATFKINGY